MAVLRKGAAALALLLGSAAALGTNYEHDGKTTYCWAIPRPTRLTNLTEADRTTVFSGAQCPLSLSLSLSPAGAVGALQLMNVTWTVLVDFADSSNAVNNSRLYFGPDNTDALRSAQIVHSNVHSCVFGTGCDPFNDGKELVDKTVNKIANFSDNMATFSDSLRFPSPGEYSVLAHIILPNFNASSRFDYAVYTKVTVLAATAAPPNAAPAAAPVQTPSVETTATKSGSSLSTGATVAIVVGAVIIAAALAVIVVMLRRRRDGHKGNGYTPAPIDDSGGGGAAAGMKQSGMSDTNSTTGFQSAWGGVGGGAGGGGVPNNRPTGADQSLFGSFPESQYAAPRPSGMRPSPEMGQLTTSMHASDLAPSEYFASGTQNPLRKKRVESDVEL